MKTQPLSVTFLKTRVLEFESDFGALEPGGLGLKSQFYHF